MTKTLREEGKKKKKIKFHQTFPILEKWVS